MNRHDPAGPTLLCSSGAFYRRPLRDAFAHISQAGFGGIEIMVTRDPATQDPDVLRALSAEHGLPIRAIHAPFLLMTRRVWGTDPVVKIDRAVALAGAVGTPLVVAHPPYRWQAAYRGFVEEGLQTLARRTGIVVALENMFPVRLGGDRGMILHTGQRIEDLERFPHVVLDTSHAAVAGLDPFDAVRRLGGRLVHIHLSNNAGRGWDSHLPLDEGVLPLGDFLDLLAADRFSGNVSLELDLRRIIDDDEALRRVLSANRAFCAERLPLPA